MAAKTRHSGLTADERSEIRSIVLETRELIENDLYRQLERYGIYEDEKIDLEHLGHLDAYDRETRRIIDAAIDREIEATEGDYQRSVKNYVREATKTYLNRLVALKAIEVRGLVTETLIERPEYGNRSEMLRTVDEVAGELTDQPDGGLSSTLELAYTELSDEIGVIFEESEYTAIDLDFTVREEIIEHLNGIDKSVWESDEAMGWVYQYFGEKEREEIDDRIDEENYKVQDTDVATKTQLFTPRYIVEWMVDNSLGRLWLEMKGEETNIDDEDKCYYLAPAEDSLIDRDLKDVRDIKIFDPACGSGHMLFYAFDVLYDMYLEEGEVAEKYIPKEILKNNLYGIDIDPGATQLAALALYVKAKSQERDVEIGQINIISADAVLVNGEKKKEILDRTNSKLEHQILDEVWKGFQHVREWGSLVQIEKLVEEIIEVELEAIEESGQVQFTDEGDMVTQSSFVTGKGEIESWNQVKRRLLSRVSELAEEALDQNDPIEEMFAGDVEKSVQLLDLFISKYDVVVSNPPYLSSGKIGDQLKNYLKENYHGYRDLYAPFIEKSAEFAGDDKYISLLTPETYMYLDSFRDLRPYILEELDIVEAAHYSHRDTDYMNISTILRCSNTDYNSRFIRLINAQDKEEGLNNAIASQGSNEKRRGIYDVNQDMFYSIKNNPFVYWFGNSVISAFESAVPLDSVVSSQSGLKSGDNKKFLRKYWEVDSSKIGDRYRPVAHSENSISYFDQTSFVVDWIDDGKNIETYGDENGHQYYFGDKSKLKDESVGFQVNSKHFLTRYIPENHIPINQLYVVVPNEDNNIEYLNGLMNSSLVKYIINGFNPSANFTQGDVFRLPYKYSKEADNKISGLVETIIRRIGEMAELRETNLEFDPSTFHETFVNFDEDMYDNLAYKIDMINSDRYVIEGLIDNSIFDLYEIDDDSKQQIYDELPQNTADFPHLENNEELDITQHTFRKRITQQPVSETDYERVVEKISKLQSDDIRKVAEEVEVSPYTVAKIRKEFDLYSNDKKQKLVGDLLSFYIGCIFGRWNNLARIEKVEDGILTFGTDFERNVESQIRECIDFSFENGYEMESEIEEILNSDITSWLRQTFFRYHHCRDYRRRGQRNPIYWHIESDESAFSCFIYYHSINADTFPKLRGQYIDTKLDKLQNRLETIESELDGADGDQARELRSRKMKIQTDIDEITEFRDRVDNLIDEGFKPDFEAGIWENLQRIDEHDLLAIPLDKL